MTTSSHKGTSFKRESETGVFPFFRRRTVPPHGERQEVGSSPFTKGTRPESGADLPKRLDDPGPRATGSGDLHWMWILIP